MKEHNLCTPSQQNFGHHLPPFPDLVPKFRTQIRLIGSFGLQGSVLWLRDLSAALCPLCNAEVEDNIHFFFNCNSRMNEWDTFWKNFIKRLRGSVHRRVKPSSYSLAIMIRLQNSLS